MKKFSPRKGEAAHPGRKKNEESSSWVEHLKWLGIQVEEPENKIKE